MTPKVGYAAVQAPVVTEMVGTLTVGMLGTTVSGIFKRAMRERMLFALDPAGDAASAAAADAVGR